MAPFLRPFRILFAYPIFVLYGNFWFRLFRFASFGFTRCIHSFPWYLHDFFVSFISTILRFRIFASQRVFVESFSRCLPITSRSLLVCLIRSSLVSQTTVLCGTSFPLYFSFCVLICLYCFRTFFVLPIWRAYLWPLSSAIPPTPIFS